MTFSTDRDLLAVEPHVFQDAVIVAQTRLTVADANVSGVTLTSAAADFTAAGVDAGSVLLIAGVPHEVLARVDANTLTVSLPRARPADPALPGPAAAQGSNLAVTCRSFAPQAELVRAALLRLVGINVDDAAGLTQDAVVSLSTLARLEVLGTLERAYSAAVSLTGEHNVFLLARAAEHRRRFEQALRRATIVLDTDGDGRGDCRIDLGVVRLTRA